jgi:hypothetical protein
VGLRGKVGHIWVIFIVFSSSKTLKMYTNRYSQLASSLCGHKFIYVLFIHVYIEDPAASLVWQKYTEDVSESILL